MRSCRTQDINTGAAYACHENCRGRHQNSRSIAPFHKFAKRTEQPISMELRAHNRQSRPGSLTSQPHAFACDSEPSLVVEQAPGNLTVSRIASKCESGDIVISCLYVNSRPSHAAIGLSKLRTLDTRLSTAEERTGGSRPNP